MAFEDNSAQRETTNRGWGETFVILKKDGPRSSAVVQILEPNVTGENSYWRHWLPMATRKNGGRGVGLVCPGISVCPVCQRNKELDKDDKEYLASNKRYFVNVLDLTPRRECPLCENVTYHKMKCSYCDTSFAEVESLEPEVKLMERGREMFNHLEVIDQSFTKLYDPNDDALDRDVYDYSTVNPGEDVPVGITHYEIKIITGSDKKPIPTRNSEANDLNWRDYVDQYVDPQDAYIFLEPEEIEQLLTGDVTLSEILKARFQQEETEEIPF